MSLALCVGILLALEDESPDDIPSWHEEFEHLNRVLEAASLPRHVEPADGVEGLPWGCEMYGYSGLHYLRRIAAHLAVGRGMPSPGDRQAVNDPVVHAYYERYERGHPPTHAPLDRFSHLMWHSDAEGFYLPLAMRDVLVPDAGMPVWGDYIGSAATLRDECLLLAEALHIPAGLEADAAGVNNAAAYQGEGDEGWQRYGVETLTCLQLIKACTLSIASGCAVVFV